MRTDADSGLAKQRLAFEAMAFDILGSLLRTAESPAALSTYLAEQLRELTGARTVFLLQCVHDSDAAGHRVVAVNPERRRRLAGGAEVGRLAELADDLRSSTVWGLGGGRNGADAILAALGCGLSIAVPLRVGKISVGVMLLLDLPDAHSIDQVVEVLDMLSTVVALVFRNALLYEEQEATIEARTRELAEANEALRQELAERVRAEEEIKRRNEELAALNAIAAATSEALNLDTILNAALQQIVAFTGVDGAECHLPDDVGALTLAMTWRLNEAFAVASRDFRFPVGGGIPGRAFARRAPVYVPDAPTDERYWRRDLARAAGYRSLLCVPILGHESLLGTFMLYSRQPREFAPGMQTLLMTVGGQLAVAIERARLHEEVQRYAADLEQRVAERTAELRAANKDLEAFAYSVSHDLRAPLRAIDGFAQALQEDYAGLLDAEGQHYLERLRAGSQHMGELIDDLLNLSRVSRQELERQPLDLAAMARRAFEELAPYRAGREIDLRVSACPPAHGDARLTALVVYNLLSNAIKFTRERKPAIIEFGYQTEGAEPAYFVRDNGVGFDMAYADKLFAPFQRLHRAEDYPGTGIGLAIVQRVVQRHAGRVWAEAGVDQGATFYFTI